MLVKSAVLGLEMTIVTGVNLIKKLQVYSLAIVKCAMSIGDFRVAFHLCFKASPSVKPFIWKLVLFTYICPQTFAHLVNFSTKCVCHV